MKVYYDQDSYIANPLQDQINFNEMCEIEYLKTFKKLVNDPLIRKIKRNVENLRICKRR